MYELCKTQKKKTSRQTNYPDVPPGSVAHRDHVALIPTSLNTNDDVGGNSDRGGD
jgi:hypothetical protein